MKDDLKLTIGQCDCFAIRRVARAVTAIYDEYLAPAGLRITQYLCLVTIRELDGISLAALAAELDLDKSTMGRNIDPLERDGLVVVSRPPADRRMKVAHLTDKGRAALAEAHPLWKAAQARMQVLLDGDRPAWRETLDRIAV